MLMLWLPSAVALLAYALAVPSADDKRGWPRHALLVGWAAHALAIVIDMAGIGSTTVGARFGFAPALSATLWLVLTVYVVESRWVPMPVNARRTLAVLGALAVALAAIFPGEFRPQA